MAEQTAAESTTFRSREPAAPAFGGESLRRNLAALSIIVGASLLVSTWPERLAGLHVDEAWSFFRAREILSGRRPLDGMNYYTGALHQYLLAAGVKAFGLHHWVIRALSGGINLAALLSYMRLVRRWHPQSDLWLWVGALTMSSATFVVYSRLGIELTTLTPFLIFTGSLLVQQGRSVARLGLVRAAGGGVLLGLAVYNHMVAAAVVAGLILGYVSAIGVRVLGDRISHAAFAGLLLGLAPRIVQILGSARRGKGPIQRLLQNLSADLFSDLLYVPEVLRGMLDGDLIYRRVAGECLLAVVPFFTVALLALIAVRLRLRALALARRDVGLLVAVAASTVLMALIAPHLALRYYILPALALPYLLARLADLPERDGARWARRLGRGVLPAVIALQAFYLGVNYFYAHLSTGGSIYVFPLGKHVIEASNGFVRVDRLYASLVERQIEHVVADNLIRWPLEFYDLTPDALRTTAEPYNRRWKVPGDGPTAMVYYNGPTPMGGLKIEDRRGTDKVDFNGREFLLEPGYDPNFLVYVHRPSGAALSASGAPR